MDRGEIYHVNLNPIAGREQAGARYVLVVTTRAFNALGTPVVVPVTLGGNFARHKGFAVSLAGLGTNTQGVVLCNQPRAIDLSARGAKFIEKLPTDIVNEVMAKLNTLFE